LLNRQPYGALGDEAAEALAELTRTTQPTGPRTRSEVAR
jgi:hypothetical protein